MVFIIYKLKVRLVEARAKQQPTGLTTHLGISLTLYGVPGVAWIQPSRSVVENGLKFALYIYIVITQLS